MSFHHRATAVFGALSVCLGIALVLRTAAAGGGAVGYLLGSLFFALGLGRLYLLRRR